jgi:hypothetical protein
MPGAFHLHIWFLGYAEDAKQERLLLPEGGARPYRYENSVSHRPLLAVALAEAPFMKPFHNAASGPTLPCSSKTKSMGVLSP